MQRESGGATFPLNAVFHGSESAYEYKGRPLPAPKATRLARLLQGIHATSSLIKRILRRRLNRRTSRRSTAFANRRVASRPYPLLRPGVLLLLLVLLAGCDGGLAPPESDRTGAILALIEYAGTWPPPDSARDVRFVAMRFVPQDTSDFLELNRLAISDRLTYGASADTVLVEEVRPGVFVYSGVAVNYSESIFAWRPVAVYEEGDGIFEVRPNDTVRIEVAVDFARLPDFPPRQ